MNQSFQQVFVTNSGTILASGTTSDLAVGQIGFFDGETYAAVTAPTFFQNKSLIVGWGYPDIVNPALMAGQFNENEKSPAIFGRKIKRVRVNRAKKPQKEIIVAGFTGDVSDTDTISIKPEETKSFYLRVTGAPIDRLYSTQGLIRRYTVTGPCFDDCADGCEDGADCTVVVKDLAKQINEDPKLKGLVKATVITECNPVIVEDTEDCFVFQVTVCDDGSDEALGYVQSQYPGFIVTRVARDGSNSTYQIIKDVNVAPADLSNAGLILIPACPDCPDGYDLIPAGFVYEIKRPDAGNLAALNTLIANYGIVAPETAVRISYQGGVSTYKIVSTQEVNAFGLDQFKLIGESLDMCVLTVPEEFPWILVDTWVKYKKVFQIQLKDDECGVNKLEDLQDAYPDLEIVIVDPAGECVHTYQTEVFSDCVKPGCSMDLVKFKAPDAFEGIDWKALPPAELAEGQTCKCGLQLESAWVDRITNECTYGFWPYEADGVHIEFSEFDPNYNGEPDKCKLNSTVVKLIQSLQYPQGNGQFVRMLEERSKGLFLKTRSSQPIVREIEGYSFIADPNKYYDELVIEFDRSYPVGGFSERYTDSYHLHIFVKEGNGAQIASTINTYITSPEIGLDAVAL